MQLGFFFDQSRCTGCYTCIVACQQWHSADANSISWRWVITLENGKYPHLSVAFLSFSCCHCGVPVCRDVCPAEAIHKRTDNGIVFVQREACLGKSECGICAAACPYDAPRFRAEFNSGMEICNFCWDRLEEGKKPLCVASCPTRALDAGPLSQLIKIHGRTERIEGFVYDPKVRPSIIFKKKRTK